MKQETEQKYKRVRYSNDILYSLPEAKSPVVQTCYLTRIGDDPVAAMNLEELILEASILKTAADRLDQVKKRLTEEIQQQGMVSFEGRLGARAGRIATLLSWQDGGSRLSQTKLIENGVLPETIEASKTKSEGYWRVEVVQIREDGR